MRIIYLTFGWVAGILIAAGLWGQAPLAWLLLALILALAVGLLHARRRWRWLLLAAVAFTLGAARYSIVPLTSRVAQYNGEWNVTLRGIVVAEPDVRDNRVDLRVEVEVITHDFINTFTSGLVLVQAPLDSTIHYGDRIAASGFLGTPFVGDTFSYQDYLARYGIFSIMPNAAVRLIGEDRANPVMDAIFDFKDRARRAIAQSLPEPDASLLMGILLGDARGLPPEVSDAFSAVGASHIIAISGFNMAILSGVVMGLLQRFRVRPRWAAVIGISTLVIYSVMVGASASVVRAAIMSSMLVIGAVIRRKSYVPASLAFVALLMSLANPLILWDVGFQLSFFATLGLALFATPFTQLFNNGLSHVLPRSSASRVGDFLAEPLVVSIAAQITTLPLIVLYFERLSLLSLVVNLLVLPVQAVLLILGLVATLIAFILPPLAQLLYWLDMLLLSWTIDVVRLFARLPFAEIQLQVEPRWITLFYTLLIGGALMVAARPSWPMVLARYMRHRLVTTTLLVSGSGLALLMLILYLSRPDGKLHVWMLDMGPGNAILIQSPDGAHILIDGGRFPSRLLTALGDRLPFNDREIEMLILTQPDPDDFIALPRLLDRYQIGVALTNGSSDPRPEYQALLAKLNEVTEVVAVTAGYGVELSDGVRLEVLYPMQTPAEDARRDDDALTLRLTYGDISFLLPSDLSPSGQAQILQGQRWPLATVLQIPSQAQRDSLEPAFLQAVQPSAIMLQVDVSSRFGQPDEAALETLQTRPVFRTDRDGTVHFWTDGQTLWAVPSR